MAKSIRDLPGLLEQADAVYHASPRRTAVAGQTRTHHDLSAFIRLSLDDHAAALRLQKAAAHLTPGWGTAVTAATILDETMTLTEAGLGDVQVVEPATQRLRIVAHAGLGREFLEHFEVVHDALDQALGGIRSVALELHG